MQGKEQKRKRIIKKRDCFLPRDKYLDFGLLAGLVYHTMDNI